ncbi:NB-ARC domain-containing protein [Actinokineospora sp. 24-640]
MQVPPGPAGFVGRESELAELDRLRHRAPVVVCGMAGVGKTSLALRWAQRSQTAFADGQLFANLGGVEPVTPSTVLEWFLLSLGTTPEQVPADLDRRAGLYRSLTARRVLLVVLDNAVSAAQVRPLLPTGPECAAVITSRARLSGLGLDGARWLDLDPMAERDSLRLLRSAVGEERVSAEAPAAEAVARLCGGLPLALSVVGARLATRARRTFARELADLAAEHTRLSELALDADASVELVLDLSRAALPADVLATYACAGRHPGREFGAAAVAAGLGWPAPRAQRALDSLVEAGMATEPEEGRYTLHDLIRLHAMNTGAPTAREAMVRWYLDIAVAADTVIHPLRPRLGPRYGQVDADRFPDSAAAIVWLDRERANLRAALDTAAARAWDDVAWQFCEALWGLFLHTRRYGEWIDMQLVGAAAAHRVGDRRAEARVRVQLAYAYTKTGRTTEASTEISTALELARAEGDEAMEASALEQLGLLTTDPLRAMEHFTRSRDLHERLGRPRGTALCRRRIGEVLVTLGRIDEAITEFTAVAATMAELGDLTQHTRAVTMLSAAHLRAGDRDRARGALSAALTTMRGFGSPHYQAEILTAMADADPDNATRWLTEAADLYDEVGDPKATAIRARLARR